MMYTFTAKQVIEITGELDAENESEARKIIESIYAINDSGDSVVFKNTEKLDNYDIDPTENIDITDLYDDDW